MTIAVPARCQQALLNLTHIFAFVLHPSWIILYMWTSSCHTATKFMFVLEPHLLTRMPSSAHDVPAARAPPNGGDSTLLVLNYVRRASLLSLAFTTLALLFEAVSVVYRSNHLKALIAVAIRQPAFGLFPEPRQEGSCDVDCYAVYLPGGVLAWVATSAKKRNQVSLRVFLLRSVCALIIRECSPPLTAQCGTGRTQKPFTSSPTPSRHATYWLCLSTCILGQMLVQATNIKSSCIG